MFKCLQLVPSNNRFLLLLVVPCGGALRRRKTTAEWNLSMNLDEDNRMVSILTVPQININSIRSLFFSFSSYFDVGSTNTLAAYPRRVKSSIHLIIAVMIVDTRAKMIEDDDDATHLNSLYFFLSLIFASSWWTPWTILLRIIAVWMSSHRTQLLLSCFFSIFLSTPAKCFR